MFLDTGNIEWIKQLTEKQRNDSNGIIDSHPGCGQPHTAHPIAKFSTVKYLALIVTTRRVSIVRTMPSQYARLSVHPSHAASVSKRLYIC